MARISLGTMYDVKNATFFKATITSIDSATDTANIYDETNNQSYTDVPIFYHCLEDSVETNGSLEGSASAFEVGDIVTVNKNPLRILSGETLKPCAGGYVLYLSFTFTCDESGTAFCLVWDLKRNAYATVLDLEGEPVVFLCSKTFLETGTSFFEDVDFTLASTQMYALSGTEVKLTELTLDEELEDLNMTHPFVECDQGDDHWECALDVGNQSWSNYFLRHDLTHYLPNPSIHPIYDYVRYNSLSHTETGTGTPICGTESFTCISYFTYYSLTVRYMEYISWFDDIWFELERNYLEDYGSDGPHSTNWGGRVYNEDFLLYFSFIAGGEEGTSWHFSRAVDCEDLGYYYFDCDITFFRSYNRVRTSNYTETGFVDEPEVITWSEFDPYIGACGFLDPVLVSYPLDSYFLRGSKNEELAEALKETFLASYSVVSGCEQAYVDNYDTDDDGNNFAGAGHLNANCSFNFGRYG